MVLLPLAACSDDVAYLSGDADAGAASSGTTASATSGPVGSTGSSASTTAPADDTRGTTSTDTTGVLFFAEPDLGVDSDCSIFTQDCPLGQKCMPWANDGGGSWNAWGCKPVADDPAGPGEPCRVEGSVASGIDDCELGAMCWDVDGELGEGVCVSLCTGAENDPTCDEPFHRCAIADNVPYCRPVCDPLQQSCPEGQACYHVPDWWECGPDASGPMGAYGDICEFLNACDPGLVCLGAEAVPLGEACEGAGGCCTEVCDLGDPLGDMQCAGAAGGQQCVPWHEPGEAPPGYEDVGVCTLP